MYSIIDTESNGDGYRHECIIDIAIFKFDGHRVVDQFMSLVNPEAKITHYVQKLTKITPKIVKTAPKFHEIAKRIIEITEGTTLVGHNIEFDYRMLRQSFQRLGYDFKINVLDTIPLAQKLIPEAESYSLGKLTESLGIPLINRHRADGDARATLELFKLLMSKDNDNEIIQKQFEETNAKSYVNRVKELTQDLPNEKGIVYLQDKNGNILYSDFMSDMNKSVKYILNSDAKKWEKIQKKCEQIHYELLGHKIIGKLILRNKNIIKKEDLPFGLYYKSEKYIVEKTNLNKGNIPLLKFQSFTQGIKVVNFIKSIPEYADVEILKQKISLKGRNEIWTTSGRSLGEKSFIILEKGKIVSFGFYKYYNQIQSEKTLNKLRIDIKPTITLDNELKLSLLKGDFEVIKHKI